ncbi:MAG TPA: NAD(P)-dependent oxidoreductase [Burkholderiales bacterium]|nr:NAD(P)-dependent oxidoreductase [Burkholderiales bacterium]
MAKHLAAAGFAVRSFDAKGTGSCASARAAAKGAEVLLTMLPDGEAVRDAVLEALPALRRGAIVIDMSSSDPLGTQALGAALAAAGIEMLDAPVSGAVLGAREATLAIMVGGAKPVFEESLPLLKALGDKIFHVGPLGAGHAVKALNNYLGAAGTLAGFEALLVARAFGLEAKPMLEAINASTGRNSTTEKKIARDILTGAYASGFRLALMAKDVGIASRLARNLKLNTPYLRKTLQMWQAAEKALPAAADHSEIYKYQATLATPPSSRKAAPSRAAPARRSTSRPRRRRST